MSINKPTIPPETARHVLWHYGQNGGHQPGSFTQRLMEAFAAADMANTAKLANAYPDYAAAFIAANLDPDGIPALQRIAGVPAIHCTRCRSEDGPFTDGGLCEACARPVPLDGVL
ncbi:hypothetical protein [Streptomyces sp. CBMA152]|uniref:hypothetical protein n=1 Tax=Streptomyces sp. CBMA152 TaxID=1896312 RepID=UPI001660646D|nr:hypothetical protein [Streptomyces sp. CBMA152]MBD0743502.1 hypothetical protein [Streptomyces sp. CBMA152]